MTCPNNDQSATASLYDVTYYTYQKNDLTQKRVQNIINRATLFFPIDPMYSNCRELYETQLAPRL